VGRAVGQHTMLPINYNIRLTQVKVKRSYCRHVPRYVVTVALMCFRNISLYNTPNLASLIM
jgi:hypothetical protein